MCWAYSYFPYPCLQHVPVPIITETSLKKDKGCRVCTLMDRYSVLRGAKRSTIDRRRMLTFGFLAMLVDWLCSLGICFDCELAYPPSICILTCSNPDTHLTDPTRSVLTFLTRGQANVPTQLTIFTKSYSLDRTGGKQAPTDEEKETGDSPLNEKSGLDIPGSGARALKAEEDGDREGEGDRVGENTLCEMPLDLHLDEPGVGKGGKGVTSA
jgi:hypothetical protein